MKQIMRGMTEGRTPQGVCVLRVHYSCDEERDPAIHPEWQEKERAKYTSQGAWDREQEIIFSAGGGERIFADVLLRWGHKIFIDPKTSGFEPHPAWKRLGGFDWGKSNPTGALVALVDFEGTIYVMREYYQPGLSPKQHVPNLRMLREFVGSPAVADPSIFYRTQAQEDGTFKAISELFAENGIDNLESAPERNELLGMERILDHWMNLEDREPTLKIVCATELRDIAKPVYGVHNDGCPNLAWELRRTRREELSATQLMNKNPSEKIVDKDNHLRDALKYLVLSLPAPTKKPAELRIKEAMAQFADDPTNAMIAAQKEKARIYAEEHPTALGGNLRQRLQRMAQQRRF